MVFSLKEDNRPLQIKVDLIGDHRKWFEEIQSKHAFPSYAEVVRYMTLVTWENDQSDSVKLYELNEIQINTIKEYISRVDIKQKYNIFTVKDFVKEAINRLLGELDEQNKSILHWEIKSKLHGDKREIALAFAECQKESPTSEVTLKDIADKLNRRNLGHIEEILDEFVYQRTLKCEVFNGTKTYHAKL